MKLFYTLLALTGGALLTCVIADAHHHETVALVAVMTAVPLFIATSLVAGASTMVVDSEERNRPGGDRYTGGEW